MDASSKIQRSIHDVRLTYKYVSRILGTYQNPGVERFLKYTILNKSDIIYAYPLSEILTARIKLTCHK